MGCGSHLDSLHLELHVILSGGLPVFPLLPAVAIFPVLHLLAVVEDHGAILRPEEEETTAELSETISLHFFFYPSFKSSTKLLVFMEKMTLPMAAIGLFVSDPKTARLDVQHLCNKTIQGLALCLGEAVLHKKTL